MAFSARLNGKANLCDLFIDCPECHKEFSFKNKILVFQFVRGLEDRDIQARVFQQAAQVEGGELSLTRTIALAQALETGKLNQEVIYSSGNLNRMSEYQHKKETG